MVCLLYGTAHAALGAQYDLTYVVTRLREAWPGVKINFRGDCGLGVPLVYETCEQLDVHYSIGIGMNSWLKKHSDSLLERAVEKFEKTGEPQRLFCAFWYRADCWPAQRWVVIKAEADAQGTNRRVIVTNRAGAFVLPGAAYDEYADRGEAENRNKEWKRGLKADRLSDHRYFANLFRLYLHAQAYNLLVHVRQHVEIPLPENFEQEFRSEASTGRERRQHHNRRREHDPWGQGQPCTWQTRLIKVAALVVQTTRRVVVHLSSSWPYLNHYEQVSRQVLLLGNSPSSDTS